MEKSDKSVYARPSNRLPLQVAVLGCFGVALLAQVALWQSHWTSWLPQGSVPATLLWLRIVADLLTVAACGSACFVLARLAWLMRRETIFRTSALALTLIIGIEGAKRLLDAMGYGTAPGGTKESAGLISLLLTGGV